MSFVNSWMMLLGGGLVSLPIVLHLIMQQKPKHIVFPALRFVQERKGHQPATTCSCGI